MPGTLPFPVGWASFSRATDIHPTDMYYPEGLYEEFKSKMAEDLNRHFSKEDIEMAKSPWKKCSTPLIIRKMENQNCIEVSLTLIRLAIIKKLTDRQCSRGHGEKRMLLHFWWEFKLVQLLWKAVWNFLKKLKLELPYDPAIPVLGIYPKKTIISKDTWPQYSLQHDLQSPGLGSNLNIQWQMKR